MRKQTLVFLTIIVCIFCAFPVCATSLPFEGNLDLVGSELKFAFIPENQDAVSLEIFKNDNNDFRLAAKLKHFKADKFDISTEINGSLSFISQEISPSKSIQARVWSQYSLVNFKPIQELLGFFEIINKKLYIRELSFNGFSFAGAIDLKSPYNVDVGLTIVDVMLKDAIDLFLGYGHVPVESNGSISGRIEMAGTLKAPRIKGYLSSFDGRVKNKSFESIFINFDLEYPYIYLSNSSVTKPDGLSFSLHGSLDLNDRPNLVQQIKRLKKSPMTLDDSSQSEWTIRRIKNEGEDSTIELKYLLRKERDGDPSNMEELDMFGIERSIQF